MSSIAGDPLLDVPRPGERRLALRVTPAAQRALRRGHPWLFAEAITQQSGEGHPGDLAVIFDDKRRFLAIGLYDPTSPLRVRILHEGAPASIDSEWLAGKLADAGAWRASLPAQGTTAYRLVHGENDGLPGLVIDRYDATLVLKVYSLAWIPRLAELRRVLFETVLWPAADDQACKVSEGKRGPERLVLRLSRELLRQPEYLYGLADGTLLAGSWDAPTARMECSQLASLSRAEGAVFFLENHLCFEADVVQGQKTGFFLDQRDNRARVERLAAGRRTLNVFAYTGGFSLYAARGGAPEVTSLDASTPALAAAERNFAINSHVPAISTARHTLLAGDAFAVLGELRQASQSFDLVVVDPPSFARLASEVNAALASYGRLTKLALAVLSPGGTLVMASCSSRVSAATFFATVNRAAEQVGRPLHEFDRTGHGIDHPILFPEGAYLKCLFATAP